MVAFLSHLNGVQDTQILDLIVRNSVNKGESFFLFVGFDAANKMEIGVVGHLSDKFLDLFSNLDSQVLLVGFSFH